MVTGKITIQPKTVATSQAVIETIAKTILLNANFEKDPGLFSGKMGAALFLYYYERYTNQTVYLELADELVMEIIGELNQHDTFYTTGLAGIGWGINHLMRNNFIEGTDDGNIFTTLNRAICNRGIPGGRSTEAYGIASYFLSVCSNTVSEHIDDEIDHSIMLEKVIFIIDEIKQFHDDLSKFLVSEAIFLKSSNDRQLDFFGLLALYSHAALTLMKAYKRRLYPSVVNDLAGKIHENLGQIVRFMQEIIENRFSAIKIKNHKFYLAFFGTLNAYNQMASCPGCQTVDLLLCEPRNIKRYISAIEKLDNTTTLTRLRINACLSRLSGFSGYTWINHIRDLEFSRCRDLLHGNAESAMALAFDNNRLNIGVAGLSGLGLSLLNVLHPDTLGWDEAILIS